LADLIIPDAEFEHLAQTVPASAEGLPGKMPARFGGTRFFSLRSEDFRVTSFARQRAA
jgi:hypothetical protein